MCIIEKLLLLKPLFASNFLISLFLCEHIHWLWFALNDEICKCSLQTRVNGPSGHKKVFLLCPWHLLLSFSKGFLRTMCTPPAGRIISDNIKHFEQSIKYAESFFLNVFKSSQVELDKTVLSKEVMDLTVNFIKWSIFVFFILFIFHEHWYTLISLHVYTS